MVEISRRNPGECIEGKDDAIAYLNAAAETGDPTLLQVAIGDVAKARGMGQVAKEAGVGRESLYKSLGKEGNPSFRTIVKVVKRTRRPHRRRIHVHRCEWDPHQRQQGWPIQGERQGIEDHRKG